MKASNIPMIETHRPKRCKPALDLAAIASKQKRLIWLSVPWVILGLAPMPGFLHQLETIGFLIVHVVCIVLCYQLAGLLRKNAIVWTLLACVPFVNLFVIGHLAGRAGRLLKAHGVRTGLMGVRSL